MGRATFAILAVLCCAWAAAEQAVTAPPQPLHKVGDHWTPYEPPTEFPPDAQVYIIQKGDTLWALAKKNLNNPYLWPQLWEKNTYIRDAHWIYPGDPLVVGVKAEEVAPPAAPPEAQPQPPGPAPGAPTPGGPGTGGAPGAQGAPGEAGELTPVGTEDDIYCFAYLDEKSVAPQLSIISAEQVEYQDSYSTNDIIYISGGEAEGVKAGQDYFVVQSAGQLHHPATGAVLGTVMRYLGQARVLCTQDHTATAEITASCDAIPIGAQLKPFDPIPIPMTVLTAPVTRCDPSSTKATGYIVYVKDDVVAFGEDTVVLIDLGDADQVAPGTQCVIFRENPVAGAPRLLLGEAAVLTTGNHWATAKVIRSYSQMHLGDRVELK
jgi:LysM repeat protein